MTQVWQFFYTAEAPCPNCASPVRTIKEDSGQPTVCLSCGSVVRATVDGTGLEICNTPDEILNQDGGMFGGGGLLDELFGGNAGGFGVDDTFGGDAGGVTGGADVMSKEKGKKDQVRRETTIIDVEADRE